MPQGLVNASLEFLPVTLCALSLSARDEKESDFKMVAATSPRNPAAFRWQPNKENFL